MSQFVHGLVEIRTAHPRLWVSVYIVTTLMDHRGKVNELLLHIEGKEEV